MVLFVLLTILFILLQYKSMLLYCFYIYAKFRLGVGRALSAAPTKPALRLSRPIRVAIPDAVQHFIRLVSRRPSRFTALAHHASHGQ